MNVLIAISSCHLYAARRAAQRDSWLKDLLPGMQYFFYVGEGDSGLEPDVVKIDAPDDYQSLSLKMHAAMRYALQKEFDWLFRVDDDTYVVPSRIETLFWQPGAEMIGGECMSHHQWSTGGAGLMFSRRLIQNMVDKGPPPDTKMLDDAWACWRSRDYGAKFHWTPRLCHHYHMRPNPYNDVVSGHYVSPKEMRAVYSIFHPD